VIPTPCYYLPEDASSCEFFFFFFFERLAYAGACAGVLKTDTNTVGSGTRTDRSPGAVAAPGQLLKLLVVPFSPSSAPATEKEAP